MNIQERAEALIKEARRFPISGAVDRDKEYIIIALWCANKVWEWTDDSTPQRIWEQVCEELEKRLKELENK